jgi:hypothetical protein
MRPAFGEAEHADLRERAERLPAPALAELGQVGRGVLLLPANLREDGRVIVS